MNKKNENSEDQKDKIEEIENFKEYLRGLIVISNMDDKTRFDLAKTLKKMCMSSCFTGLKNRSRFSIEQSFISLTFKSMANDLIVSNCKVIVDNKEDPTKQLDTIIKSMAYGRQIYENIRKLS